MKGMVSGNETRGRMQKRCDQCCPICKHQCRLNGRHTINLHECAAHVWGRKALTLKPGFEYPAIVNEELS